jgi:hypothetical protein
MSLVYGAQDEYNSSHRPALKLKFPIVHLINKYLQRLSSSVPLRWRIENTAGVVCDDISGEPRKRLKHWRKGRLLEEAIENGAVRLGLGIASDPEKLEPMQIFRNCCYENNGYGADFILRFSEDVPAIVEAKVRKGYLEPSDIKRSLLSRFYDLDPRHEELWLLVYWGRVSNEAKDLLWKHEVVLILVPFEVSLQNEITPVMRDRLSAYIAARMRDLMSMFTTLETRQACSNVSGSVSACCCASIRKCNDGELNKSHCLNMFCPHYYIDFSVPSLDFNHNAGREYRRQFNEMDEQQVLSNLCLCARYVETRYYLWELHATCDS